MNSPTTERPSARAFYTRYGAAHALGVSQRTVTRMVGEGKLHPQYPIGGPGERRPLLFPVNEVEAMRDARALVKGSPDGDV